MANAKQSLVKFLRFSSSVLGGFIVSWSCLKCRIDFYPASEGLGHSRNVSFEMQGTDETWCNDSYSIRARAKDERGITQTGAITHLLDFWSINVPNI